MTSRNRARRRIAAPAALLLALAASAAHADQVDMSAYYDPGPSRFGFRVYCDQSAVSDAQTGNTLTLSMWNGSELISLAPHVGVECNAWYDPNRNNASFTPSVFGDAHGLPMDTTNHKPTHIVIETDGDDGFFADWIEMVQYSAYDEYGGQASRTRKIGQWGAPGGRGFCLSRDPNDLSRDWAQASDACDAAIMIDIAQDGVFTGSPVELAQYDVRIDCVHRDLTRTETGAPIVLSIYADDGGLLATRTIQHYIDNVQPNGPTYDQWRDQQFACDMDESNWYPQFEFYGVNALPAHGVASVVIAMGDYQVYDEEAKLNARYCIDQVLMTRNWVQNARWGGQDGSGWCLTHWPETWTGQWAALSVGCFGGVDFEIATQDWLPAAAR